MAKLKTHKEYVAELKIKQPHLILLSQYKNGKTNVLVANKYGVCSCRASFLLQCCPVSIETSVNKNLYFINRAIEIHGDKYDYSNIEYKKNKDKIKITCPIHGEFEQAASRHLQGAGCLQCSKYTTMGYSRTDFIKKAKGRLSTCYIIRCYDKRESFYKIGITSVSLKKRFHASDRMPYDYEVIKEFKGSPGFVFDKEKELHKINKEFKYKPLNHFGGETECFTEYKIESL